MRYRSPLLLLSFLVAWVGTSAQQPDVEAWMARHFGKNVSVAQDPAADSAVHKAFGLDSLRSNRFIGRIRGRLYHAATKASVEFVLWTDTLEAVLQVAGREDTTTYLADLLANTITIAHATKEKRTASVNDLRDRVIMNWIFSAQDGSPWRVYRVEPYDAYRAPSRNAMDRYAVVKGDTVRFRRHDYLRSPFLDALEWMPFNDSDPFRMFTMLGRVGDNLPMSMQDRNGSMAIINLNNGEPKPVLELGTYAVTDTRSSTRSVPPIRTSNARAEVLDFNPPPPKMEGERWTDSPYPPRPDNPTLTYTGTRHLQSWPRQHACGAVGKVVVNFLIDQKGMVQGAELDHEHGTLRSTTCEQMALEAAEKARFGPVEGTLPVQPGSFTFTFTE